MRPKIKIEGRSGRVRLVNWGREKLMKMSKYQNSEIF